MGSDTNFLCTPRNYPSTPTGLKGLKGLKGSGLIYFQILANKKSNHLTSLVAIPAYVKNFAAKGS